VNGRFTREKVFARALLVANLLLFALAILLMYDSQLAEANAYFGYHPVGFEPAHLALLVVSVVAAAMLMPVRIERPSDFLSLFFGLFVIVPYAALHSIHGPIAIAEYLLNFLVLVLPVVFVLLASRSVPRLRLPALLPPIAVEATIALICIGGAAYAVMHAPPSAGIDIGGSYERRIEGRAAFPAGELAAYVNAAVVNGLAPLAAFVGGLWRQRLMPAIALASGLAFFYVLGVKAPLFYVVLAWSIGVAVRKGRVGIFPVVVFALLWGALFVSYMEYSYGQYSLVADYFLRRVFAVPPFVLGNFFDFLFEDAFSGWSVLSGKDTPLGITFYIGEWYLGTKGTNANTNAFVYALASGGVPAYLLTAAIVAIVFSYLDAVFRSRNSPGMLFAGFLYGILLVEQAATTALVSSGVAAVIVLASLLRRRRTETRALPAA
jgi:hypothetical protein